jgi:lysophospholipase L1-like esterase
MLLLLAVFVASQFLVHFSAGPLAWITIAGAGLWLIAGRRPARDQTWQPAAAGGLVLIGLTMVFWRHGVTAFVTGTLVSVMVLAVGLAMRDVPLVSWPSRTDLVRAMAALVSIVVTVLLLEVSLRLGAGLFPADVRQAMQADRTNYGIAHEYIGHLHRPSAAIELVGRDYRAVHHVDHLGFRNRSPWPATAEIVTVGDSLTFGYGVPDDAAWPALVARALSPVSLINLGLIGAGPEQYVRVYETFGAALRPRVLLVGFFGQNDFWDAGMFDRWVRFGLEPNYMIWRDFGQANRLVLDIRAPVETATRLVREAGFRTMRSTHIFNLLRSARRGEAGPPPRVIELPGGRLQLFEADFLDKRFLGQADRPEFRVVLDSLVRLHALAREQGTQVIVVLQPGKEEVYLPVMTGTEVTDTTAALRSALSKAGIEYLDLGPPFRERAAAGARLFNEVDGHPNAEGYALTAEVVAARLRSGR